MRLVFSLLCICLLLGCSRQLSREKTIDSVVTEGQETSPDYSYSTPIEEEYPFVLKKQLEESDFDLLCFYLTKDLRSLYLDIIGALCYSSFRNNAQLNDSFLSFLSSNQYDEREVLSELFGLLLIDLANDNVSFEDFLSEFPIFSKVAVVDKEIYLNAIDSVI